jgi:hypothetical protein
MDYKDKLQIQELISNFDDVNLPETTCSDLLRGGLSYLSSFTAYTSNEAVNDEPILLSDLYNNLIVYCLASFVVRNYAGKYVNEIALLDAVMKEIDPQWNDKKEKVKNIGKVIIEIADDIADDDRELKFLFGTSSMLGLGFIPALKHIKLDKKQVIFVLMAFGAAVGVSLFLLCDVFKFAGNINKLLEFMKILEHNVRNQGLR